MQKHRVLRERPRRIRYPTKGTLRTSGASAAASSQTSNADRYAAPKKVREESERFLAGSSFSFPHCHPHESRRKSSGCSQNPSRVGRPENWPSHPKWLPLKVRNTSTSPSHEKGLSFCSIFFHSLAVVIRVPDFVKQKQCEIWQNE